MGVHFDRAIPEGVVVIGELVVPEAVTVPAAPFIDRTTIHGWPYRLFRTLDGYVAMYVFEDHVGLVRATGRCEDAVLAVLDAARPDWRTANVIALHQLWAE